MVRAGVPFCSNTADATQKPEATAAHGDLPAPTRLRSTGAPELRRLLPHQAANSATVVSAQFLAQRRPGACATLSFAWPSTGWAVRAPQLYEASRAKSLSPKSHGDAPDLVLPAVRCTRTQAQLSFPKLTARADWSRHPARSISTATKHCNITTATCSPAGLLAAPP